LGYSGQNNVYVKRTINNKEIFMDAAGQRRPKGVLNLVYHVLYTTNISSEHCKVMPFWLKTTSFSYGLQEAIYTFQNHTTLRTDLLIPAQDSHPLHDTLPLHDKHPDDGN
jgi:hypothetical protein